MVSLFLPLALRRDKTFRPLAVDILSIKPCLLRLFLFDGWYVLFIANQILKLIKSDGKGKFFFINSKLI
jgi:hypothetical protein